MLKQFNLSDVDRIEVTGVSVQDPPTPDSQVVSVASANDNVDCYIEDRVLYVVGGVSTENASSEPAKYNINLGSVSGLHIGETFHIGETSGKTDISIGGRPLVSIQYPPSIKLIRN